MTAPRWTRHALLPVAECDVCEWATDDEPTKAAKRHAVANPGHNVRVERVTVTEYVVLAGAAQ
jgi:hypothetical protein